VILILHLQMTIKESVFQLRHQLLIIYPDREATVIAEWVIQHIAGLKGTGLLAKEKTKLTEKQKTQLQQFTEKLLKHEPVQYVLNEAWFCGFKFYVDKNVLIPRPETDELVEWIISNCKFPVDALKILDIGSGSGCIPITLKRKLRKAEVWSCDISEAALKVAKKNAAGLGVDVTFFQTDFLNKEQRDQLPGFDIIVSNPPYIPEKDKIEMQPNVLQYEPPAALFVPDNDALVFYKAIADFGKQHLNKNGAIYMEVHENYAMELAQFFQSNSYLTEIKKDMQGKERMLKASHIDLS